MSIYWVRNVKIDGVRNTLEILLGSKHIGDKSYAKVGKGPEIWFEPPSIIREEVLRVGVAMLRNNLKGKLITYKDGRKFDWK